MGEKEGEGEGEVEGEEGAEKEVVVAVWGRGKGYLSSCRRPRRRERRGRRRSCHGRQNEQL